MSNKTLKREMLVAGLTILLAITSICTIAFGVDRICNHGLYVGGGAFIAIGIVGLLFSFQSYYISVIKFILRKDEED